MNKEEFDSIKLLKLKYRRRGIKYFTFFAKLLPPLKLAPPYLVCRNSKTLRKKTPESCRMFWNLMNDEEFGSRKFLKFKYRRGGPNNSDFPANLVPSRN